MKRYVRDNIEFLKHWSRVKSENTIFANFNKVSLYTNILHAYGVEALSYWLHKYIDSLPERFNKQFVLETARLAFGNNNCNFNAEFFVQIGSTAMWTIFAPTYATLSMGYFKSKFCRICIDGLGETLDQWC